MMVDLDYDPTSFVGPVDPKAIRSLEKYHGFKLDPSYLEHVKQFHGGIPGKQYFEAQDEKTYRVGRFLTLLAEDSRLQPPFRESWLSGDRDVRIDWSALTLINIDGPSCMQLFCALLPFAALYRGPYHPDDNDLLNAECNLVCFRAESKRGRPRVVVWLAKESAKEYLRWEKAGCDEVRFADFTVPAAEHFEAFLKLLREKP